MNLTRQNALEDLFDTTFKTNTKEYLRSVQVVDENRIVGIRKCTSNISPVSTPKRNRKK